MVPHAPCWLVAGLCTGALSACRHPPSPSPALRDRLIFYEGDPQPSLRGEVGWAVLAPLVCHLSESQEFE